MFAQGTFVNILAIIFAAIIGSFMRGKLTFRYQEAIVKSLGVAVIFIAIGSIIPNMIAMKENMLVFQHAMMMVISLSIGTLVGEFFQIEEKIEIFGNFLKIKSGNTKDPQFVEGFVTASLTICIGAMAVVGSIRDGLYHDPTILYTKSVLDFFFILIMSTSLGKGCGFSAITVAIFQLSITSLAIFFEPIFTPLAITYLSYIGSVLIFCVGINMVFGKTIKVSNLLPALLVAIGVAFLF